MRAFIICLIAALATTSCHGFDGGVKYMICLPDSPCVQVSGNQLRSIMADPETNFDEADEVIIPEEKRNAAYLFRSRRDPPEEDKRSSSYLLRTRKAAASIPTYSAYDPRSTRGEYLFRTRKSMERATRAGYLFRTRKMDPNEYTERMMRSSQGRGYLFRTR